MPILLLFLKRYADTFTFIILILITRPTIGFIFLGLNNNWDSNIGIASTIITGYLAGVTLFTGYLYFIVAFIFWLIMEFKKTKNA